MTAILSGLRNCFFFSSSFVSKVFSQWGFPLLLDFLSDIWISLWCNNHDAIIFYIRYIILYIPVWSCLILSVPVCSIHLNFLSDIWFFYDAIIFYIRCIILSTPVYSCLFLSDPVWSCLFLSDPVWNCLFLTSRFPIWYMNFFMMQ